MARLSPPQLGTSAEGGALVNTVQEFRAVVPPHIARKWNSVAFRQLAEAVPQLDMQLEDERRERNLAEDCARMWQDIHDIRERGGEVGLTVEGHIVEVPK